MASRIPGDLSRPLNRLFEGGAVGALTDGQLLERFGTGRGPAAEAAFEGLVARHGSMVLRACRSVLRDPHAVDDAFQATFLVLVRKADSIGDRTLLAPWLYGVARRVALKARGQAARRSRREGTSAADAPEPADAGVADAPWLDLRPVLHEELDRLPEKYRKPVILCHLQGMTHSEAAQELAWPVGTVSVRLSRARKLLHDRLSRRGLSATAALWVAALTAEAAAAAVPSTLIRSTAALALAIAGGRGIAAGSASAGVISLTRRTAPMMLGSPLKWLGLTAAITFGVVGGSAATMFTMARVLDLRPKPAPPTIAQAQEAPSPESGRPPSGDRAIPGGPEDQPTPPPQVEPPLVVRDGRVELDPPPGFFDLPAPTKGDGTDPPIIKPGQVLDVEVLEALPARPIQGERIVRPDGTISLGFYGDLRVAGLNRYQAKAKLIELLIGFLNDEVVGLINVNGRTGKYQVVKPVDSNRVFIDESRNYYPGGVEKAPRPPSDIRPPNPNDPFLATSDAQIKALQDKLDAALQEIKALQEAKAPPR